MNNNCEQQNSALSRLKSQTRTVPSLLEQQANTLYTMPVETVERLEDVLRRTLALQEDIRATTNTLATKENLTPLATKTELTDWLDTAQQRNRETHKGMGEVLSEMKQECQLDGKRRDEFTRKLSDMEKQLQNRSEDILEQFQSTIRWTILTSVIASGVVSILLRLLLK